MSTETRGMAGQRMRAASPLALAGLLAVASVLLGLGVGRYSVAPQDIVAVLGSRLFGMASGVDAMAQTIVWEVRMPRVLAGLMVGASLATAGAVYQGLFRNPLVSPDILGVSAGAGLGAVAGIFFALPVLAVQGLSFAGGLGAVALVYTLGSAMRRGDPALLLVLAGIAVGALLGAMISLLKVLADPYNQLPAITFWLLGSLSGVTRADALSILPVVVLGLVPLALLRWRMNLMTLDDEEARSLGVDTRRTRIVLVAAATMMTAAAVSISGIVGWVGLLVPHIARLLVGPDFSRLLPASILIGGAFLVCVDTLARTVAAIEVPLGILTAAVGTPFFLWLLARAGSAWR